MTYSGRSVRIVMISRQLEAVSKVERSKVIQACI